MTSRVHGLALLIAALTFGCEGGPSSHAPYPPCVTSETLELRTLLLEVESDVGTVRGVDLDGVDTDTSAVRSSSLGCEHEDWDDPDGSRVDNNFGVLAATIEAGFDTDPRDLFAGNALTLEVEGRGDGVCVAVSVALAGGPSRTAEWNGSALRAYDLGDLPLRLSLPGVSETVTLHDTAVRVTLTAGRRVATVILSGGLDIDELTAIAADSAADLDESLIRTVLEGVADLEPDDDGYCTRISVGLEALP